MAHPAQLGRDRRPRGGLFVGLWAAAALGVTASATGQAAGFSAAEREHLLAGELVRRPVSRHQGGARTIGGTSWQRVRAPRERVWRAVLDVDLYPRMIPGVVEARRVEGDEADGVVFLRHRYSFVDAAYYAKVRVDESRYTVSFELDRSRPHDVVAGHGFLTVDAFRRTESIVTWGVMADVGQGILTGVFAPLIHDWILRVPWCVRGQLEPGTPGC